MADYKQMYFSLFNTVTDAIKTLQKAQREGEENYLNNEDIVLSIIDLSEEEMPTSKQSDAPSRETVTNS